MKKIFSKFAATFLILSCIMLSSPSLLLADTEPGNDAQAEADAPAPAPVDIQPAQPDQPPTAEVQLDAPPVPSIEEATTPADQPAVDAGAQGDPAAVNTDTGAGSENIATTEVDNQTDVTNQNYAEVFNDSFLKADTGNNNATYNTGSGIITTQKAEGDGQLLNSLNINSIEPQQQCGEAGCVNAENNGTGAGSGNLSEVNINNQLTIKNINEANVINRLTAKINSGNNNASYNTGHGMIATSDANLGLNFFTLANTNLVGSQKFYANQQNIYNSFIGNVDLSNELAHGSSALSGVLLQAANNSTGAGSGNQAIVNVNDQTSITNQNKGNINNEIDATVVSGQNKTNYNTGTGSIASGNVNSAVSVVNFLNSNITSGSALLKTINVFGDWQGDLKLPSMPSPNLALAESETFNSVTNTGTGTDSDNSASANENNSLALTNNNQAVIENNVAMITDSGSNDASYNGGSGIVQIGSAHGETNEMNVANSNITGDSWFLVVINRFGNWNGTALGAPDSVAISSTGVSTVLVPDQGGINVQNNATGPDSNNDAGVNFNHSTGVSNTNTANIVNTLNIHAVSGQNQAQENTGHGFIKTGNVRGVNNIVNFANTNITVGNWVVVVVNVFGDWNGNLIFSTPGGGGNLPVGGSLSCPVFNQPSSPAVISGNIGTGAGSQNNASALEDTNSSANSANNTNVNNTTGVSSTTGENDANYNTGNATINTGQADAGSSVANEANANSASPGGGVNSENNSNASADNNVSGSNSTGQNSSNYNTGPAQIDTGWAQAFLNLINKVNDNTVTIGDLTNLLSAAQPGQQVQVPDGDLSAEVCPGVVIEITPAIISLTPGGAQAFVAVAKDPSGNVLPEQPEFTWNATGGTIDETGNYTAGIDAGTFAVTATASYGNNANASITINAPSPSGGGGGGGGGGPIVYYAGGSSAKKHLRGDYNDDGKIDDLDLSILMSNWGLKRTGFLFSDNADGLVNDSDFSILMSNWTILNIAKNI